MKWFVIILSLVLFVQCRKDNIKPTPKKQRPAHTKVLVNASIFGVVTDEDGLGRKKVEVFVGDRKTITDDKGYFLIKDVLIDKEGATVQVKSRGYFNSMRVVRPDLNVTSAILIETIGKKAHNQGSVLASNGGRVLADGVQLEIPSKAIVDSGQNPVEEEVSVFIRWINPELSNTNTSFPGIFLGEDKEYVLKSLFPYGMIAVELERQNGEVLDFASNASVKARIPLPKALASSAPATIPLWYFDVSLAKWVEKGEATLSSSGDSYEAPITKTGYWSVQDKKSPVQFSMRLLNASGTPADYLKVTIVDRDRVAYDGVLAEDLTNEKGEFTSYLQAEHAFVLKVYNDCDQIVEEKAIGPFQAGRKAEMGDLYLVNKPGNTPFSIVGTLYDCDWSPIADGTVRLNNSRFPITAITDEQGIFSIGGYLCTNEKYVEIVGYDPSGKEVSGINYLLPYTDVSLGPLPVCDARRDSFMAVRVDGEWHVLDGVYTSWGTGNDNLDWSALSLDSSIILTVQVLELKGIGDYPVDTVKYNYTVEFEKKNETGRAVKDSAVLRIIQKETHSVTGVISQGLIRVYDYNNRPLRDTRVDVFFKLPLP